MAVLLFAGVIPVGMAEEAVATGAAQAPVAVTPEAVVLRNAATDPGNGVSVPTPVAAAHAAAPEQNLGVETFVAKGDTAGAYTVQPGDVLGISVWKEQDLQGEVLVRPDGGFSFPLVGEVMGAGKTIAELQREISSRIEKFVPDAVVTVSVRQPQGHRIYVVGRVNRPGEYVTPREVDVMQALSLAGGATPFAALNKIKVLRRSADGQTAIPFRYEDVERGRHLEQNILLQGGDVVVVP